MKYAALAATLLLASSSVQAQRDKHDGRNSCDVSSRYSVSTHQRAFMFTQDDRKPAEIGIGGGRIFIDGGEAKLSAADHQRVRQLEAEMHDLIPEVRRVTAEAVEIAFAALSEVARGLASDPQATIARLESAHQRVRREISAQPLTAFNDDAMEAVIKPILTEYVPDIVGGAVSSALTAAFSGEKKAKEFEARMQRMERELDTRVEARAKALEPLADAMCARLRRMDALDDTLEFRLPDGESLQLLRVERPKSTDAP